MSRRDGAGMRRDRLQIILDFLDRNNPVELNRLVGVVVLRTGLTAQRVRDYIKELEGYGLLNVDGEDVVHKGGRGGG